MMERMTVDNPRNNRETLLNYAYAKDGRVYLSYADGECGVDLCEYIAKNACCQEVDAAAIMDGACMECDNKTAILYTVAVQAAELRERLAYYEDLEEQGRLYITPCKLGQMVYRFQRYFNDATLQSEVKIKPCRIESVSLDSVMTEDHVFMRFSDFGETVFLTREAAEQALRKENWR